MRSRPPRKSVLIAARMRAGRDWSNVTIRNMSAQGMLLWSETPPAPGSYIEICGSATTLVARTMWVKDGYFGVRAQDRIDVESAMRGGKWRPSDPRPPQPRERRPSDAAVAHSASRQLGTSFQFSAAILAGLAGAALLAMILHDLLSESLGVIGSALAGTVG